MAVLDKLLPGAAPGESLRCLPKAVDPRESMDPRGPKEKLMADGLGLDPWWDEPAYKTCNTFHLRGLFILRKLREHDSTNEAPSGQKGKVTQLHAR